MTSYVTMCYLTIPLLVTLPLDVKRRVL